MQIDDFSDEDEGSEESQTQNTKQGGISGFRAGDWEESDDDGVKREVKSKKQKTLETLQKLVKPFYNYCMKQQFLDASEVLDEINKHLSSGRNKRYYTSKLPKWFVKHMHLAIKEINEYKFPPIEKKEKDENKDNDDNDDNDDNKDNTNDIERLEKAQKLEKQAQNNMKKKLRKFHKISMQNIKLYASGKGASFWKDDKSDFDIEDEEQDNEFDDDEDDDKLFDLQDANQSGGGDDEDFEDDEFTEDREIKEDDGDDNDEDDFEDDEDFWGDDDDELDEDLQELDNQGEGGTGEAAFGQSLLEKMRQRSFWVKKDLSGKRREERDKKKEERELKQKKREEEKQKREQKKREEEEKKKTRKTK